MTTERDLWKRLRPQFVKAGAYPIRIENAANTSLPDVILVYPRKTVFIELKIIRSGRVYMPKYQFALAADLAGITDLFYLMAWWDRPKELHLWKYRDILPYVWGARGNYTTFFEVKDAKSIVVPDLLEWAKQWKGDDDGR